MVASGYNQGQVTRSCLSLGSGVAALREGVVAYSGGSVGTNTQFPYKGKLSQGWDVDEFRHL